MTEWNEELDPYIGHFTKYQNNSNSEKDPENKVKFIDSDIGRNVGYQRIAVHHMIIPAGCRSSSPHAESLEEEFVLVLKGTPHLWLNGYIYDLKEGHAAGFPAGTGIAHTFINNTNEEVHLLVAGEKTKPENLCSFPINPELKESCEIWWENSPPQKLGPHNGLPGPIKENERSTDKPNCLTYCPSNEKTKGFHYPGDNETFGNGFRLTDKIDLKSLGIWFESLPAHHRSSFPHAHTHEEEFVYIIQGQPTVWIDGYTKKIEPEHFAAFPSKTGMAHTLINDTDEEVIYLCIGETADFKDEKITYPLNPLRNQECARKGWLWEDLPPKELGPHSGKPEKPFENHLSLRICSENNIEEILNVFQKSKNYLQEKSNLPLKTEGTQRFTSNCLQNTNSKYFKEFLIIEKNEVPAGAVSLHVNYPKEEVCSLELLLLGEQSTPQEYYHLIEDYIKRALSCNEIYTDIEKNTADFWIKMGFKENKNSRQNTSALRKLCKSLRNDK